MPTSKAMQVNAQQRRYRVLQAVLAGASERQIAEQEGVARSLINRDKKKVLSDLAKEHIGLADEVRSVQMERYNQIMLRWWQRAMSGDKEATDVILRVMKEINVINGVIPDKPLISFNQLNVGTEFITFNIEANDDTTEANNDISETEVISETRTGYILEQ
tara:strand:- start:7414 stop:7896 length:483 start_codon:yes stop_codon:yes gene_type:complete